MLMLCPSWQREQQAHPMGGAMWLREEEKKGKERFWVAETARFLNETWELQQREEPDFGVTSAGSQFGLEVTECYIGPSNRNGSKMRKEESYNVNLLEGVRMKYQDLGGIVLDLQYLGDSNDQAMTDLLNALMEADLGADGEFAERVEVNFPGGKAFVRRSPTPRWASIGDQVGWVSQNEGFLQREIDKKSSKLLKYRENFSNVRLLVVANRTYNSGKLRLKEGFQPDLRGFDAVYFFSYPVEVHSFFPEVK